MYSYSNAIAIDAYSYGDVSCKSRTCYRSCPFRCSCASIATQVDHWEHCHHLEVSDTAYLLLYEAKSLGCTWKWRIGDLRYKALLRVRKGS